MDRANRVLGIYNVSSGGITGTIADAIIVLAAARKINSCGIIIGHNHPSGNISLSVNGQALTNNFKMAASILIFSYLIIL